MCFFISKENVLKIENLLFKFGCLIKLNKKKIEYCKARKYDSSFLFTSNYFCQIVNKMFASEFDSGFEKSSSSSKTHGNNSSFEVKFVLFIIFF